MRAIWDAVIEAPWLMIPAFLFLAVVIFFAVVATRLPRRRSERVEAFMRRPEDLLNMNRAEMDETLSEVWRSLTYTGEGSAEIHAAADESHAAEQAGISTDAAPDLKGNDMNERPQ